MERTDESADNEIITPGPASEAMGRTNPLEYYAGWAPTYDATSQEKRYRGWECVRELALRHLHKTDIILAVGAGTGVEGEVLKKEGFQCIHGHDGSAEMLEVARKRNAFDEYFHEFLDPDHETKCFRTKYYDAVICVGCFLPNHLDERHIPDLTRCLKPGGTFILGTREKFIRDPGADYNYPFNLELCMQQMDDDGVWKLIDRRRYERYSEGDPGVFFVYRKT